MTQSSLCGEATVPLSTTTTAGAASLLTPFPGQRSRQQPITAQDGTHVHQRVVRLFPGVEQEVERPPVVTPLHS